MNFNLARRNDRSPMPRTGLSQSRVRFSNQDGYTLIEMMIVVGLIGLVGAMAMVAGPSVSNTAKADSGTEQVIDMLRSGREMAVSQRRNVEVRFIGTNGMQTVRRDIGLNGVSAGTTTLRTIELQNRVQFRLDPDVTVDTPDRFGNSTATAFGPTNFLMFTSEGQLVDGNGDILNGTVTLSIPGQKNSARAITVMGITALIRAWRWDGKKWVE